MKKKVTKKMAEALRQIPDIKQLTSRQIDIINSYKRKVIDFNHEHSHPSSEVSFSFSQTELPEHGQVMITQAELDQIKSSEQISPQFQGQPDLTVAELSQAAAELLNSPAWKKLYEDSIPSTKDSETLTSELEHTYKTYEKLAQKHGVSIPLFDENIRRVVATIFTRLPKYDAQSVYSILSAGRAYGLFHRFCTQSFPVNFEPILTQQSQKRSFVDSIMSTFLPYRIKKLKAQLIKLSPNQLGPETKWRAIDKETRINLAQEMFTHVRRYLEKHPQERVIIIEPGGGNAELSVILAEQIANNPITSGKATILVREYSLEMAEEGQEKITNIENQNPDLDLDIEFLIGSADIPLTTQLAEIKQAITENNLPVLEEKGLNLSKAHQLLEKLADRKIIGGISTYTAGAMSNEDGIETTATRVFDNLVSEVDANEGFVIINDFAATPPPELESDPLFAHINVGEISFLREASQSFEDAGLSHGLATVYGLWGEGSGHDTRQIWQTYLKLYKENSPDLTVKSILRPFSLFPLPFSNRYLNIPGFIESTIRCRGRAQNSQIKV